MTVWLLYPRRPIPHCRAMMCSRTCVVRVYRHHRIYSLLPLLFVALLVLLSHRHRSHVIHAGIPTLSISDVVNNFVPRRPSPARHQRHHSPAKSFPRIEPLPTGEVSGALLRRAGSEAHSSTHRPVSSGQNRDLQGSDSTASVGRLVGVRWGRFGRAVHLP
jgi:hypothetical protein